MGGIDFAQSAFETVLEYTQEKEWPPLEEQILAAMKGSSDWARGNLIKLIAVWREKHGRYDEADVALRSSACCCWSQKENQTAVLLDIALYEGNVKRSLNLLPALQDEIKRAGI